MLAPSEIQNAAEQSGLQQPQRNQPALSGQRLIRAIQSAIERPLDYPSLSEMVYTGDCVVIALQAATRDGLLIVKTLVEAIQANRAEGISVTVLADAFTAAQLDLSSLPEVSLAIHDPDGDNLFACLAIGSNDQPLHINRLLFDADIVIPVGCLAPQQDFRIDDFIFPGFSNRRNLEAFRDQTERDRADDVQHVNDQLGTFFAVQLVIGPGDSIQAVLAGDRRSVLKAAKQQLAKAWEVKTDQSADLVVATIESHVTEQTWDDFARALINADRCSKVSAPIVICTELNRNPPRETRAILVNPEPSAERKSASLVTQMQRIIAEHPVFLASNLPQATVEEIGLGHLSATEPLQRMCEKSSQGLFLRDAHKCEITVVGDG